ncbi:helix-turn-helix domain-containing protein [Pedobacter frigidisoli]|nr:helix-turn-helix transcriptional regulator [Pedobacter frigidisoli]
MNSKLRPENQNLIHNIKNLRLYRGFSQNYVASKIEVSQNGYSKIEMGHAQLTLVRLFQIAEVLQAGAVELLVLTPNELLISVVERDHPERIKFSDFQ